MSFSVYFKEKLLKHDIIRKIIKENIGKKSINKYITIREIVEQPEELNKAIILKTNFETKNIKENVIIKSSFFEQDFSDISTYNSFEIEMQIHENIIRKLISNFNSPCLVDCLGSRLCIEKSKKSKEKRTTVLLLEEIKYLTLSKYIFNKSSLDVEEFLSLIFQIYYTLLCFNRVLLRHNDIHLDNILIEELPEKMSIYFEVPKIGIVKIKTKFLVKIYDYDRSSAINSKVERNSLLDFLVCELVGTCNKFNPKFDTFKITMDLKHILSFEEDSRRENINDPVKNLLSIFENKEFRLRWNLDSELKENNDSHLEDNNDSHLEDNNDSHLEDNNDSHLEDNNDSDLEEDNDSHLEDNNDSDLEENNDSENEDFSNDTDVKNKRVYIENSDKCLEIIKQFYNQELLKNVKTNMYRLLQNDDILNDDTFKTNEQILKVIINNSKQIKIINENKRNEIESNNIIFKPPEQVVPKIIKFKPTKEIKEPLNSLENIKKYYVIGDLQDFEDIKPFMENYYNENKNSLNELISKFYEKFPYTRKLSEDNRYTYNVALTILSSKTYNQTVEWIKQATLNQEKYILQAMNDVFVVFDGVLPFEISKIVPIN
jgi:hypothetical protein